MNAMGTQTPPRTGACEKRSAYFSNPSQPCQQLIPCPGRGPERGGRTPGGDGLPIPRVGLPGGNWLCLARPGKGRRPQGRGSSEIPHGLRPSGPNPPGTTGNWVRLYERPSAELEVRSRKWEVPTTALPVLTLETSDLKLLPQLALFFTDVQRVSSLISHFPGSSYPSLDPSRNWVCFARFTSQRSRPANDDCLCPHTLFLSSLALFGTKPRLVRTTPGKT